MSQNRLIGLWRQSHRIKAEKGGTQNFWLPALAVSSIYIIQDMRAIFHPFSSYSKKSTPTCSTLVLWLCCEDGGRFALPLCVPNKFFLFWWKWEKWIKKKLLLFFNVLFRLKSVRYLLLCKEHKYLRSAYEIISFLFLPKVWLMITDN